MGDPFWHKQGSSALFGALEWNKPERRDHAGKICILGGNVHNLGAPSKAYEVCKAAGPSALKLVLPDKTKVLVGKVMPEALYLPSTASGEFSREGEVELLDHLVWADSLLLAGDIGRNSEATILLEDCLGAYKDLVVVTRDAVDSLSNHPELLTERDSTTLVLSFAQLQKLIKNLNLPTALAYGMDLVQLVSFLHEFTSKNPVTLVTLHQNQLIVAYSGRVSTTKTPHKEEPPHWRVQTASLVACYQTWYPKQPFEAATQACFLVTK